MNKNIVILLAITLFLLICFVGLCQVANLPLAHATGGITRVQGPARGSGTNSPITVVLTNAPISGDMLFSIIGTISPTNTVTISSITESGVTWTLQSSKSSLQSGYYYDVEIWAGVVGSGASTSITIAISGVADNGAYADVCEYSGVLTSNFLDQIAINAGTGTTATTGTTSTTTQANELWIGAIISNNGGFTPAENGFSLLTSVGENEAYLQKIVTTTGTASTGLTITGSGSGWAGCIATFISAPIPESITITSSPTTGSGFVTVDGNPITTPYTFTWNTGDTHTITANSPVNGGTGTQYAFNSWNDSGTQSHTYTVPSSSDTVTASYTTQYYLTVSTSNSSQTGQGWYNSGTTAYAGVSTSPVSGGSGIQYAFSSWTGDASGSDYSQSNGITMNSAKTATATWITEYYLTVSSAHAVPSGAGWYKAGDTAYAGLDTNTVSGGTGTQYVFTSWSTGGTYYAQSTGITMNSAITTTANWQTQYYLTVSSAHDTPTGQGWYNSGTSISSTVTTPVAGATGTQYVTSGWTGTGSLTSGGSKSSATTGSFSITAPSSCTWNWLTQYQITPSNDAYSTITPSSATWVNASDSQLFTYSASSTGYNISSVLVDGSPVSITGSYTFSNVQTLHSIAVSATLSLIYSSIGVNSTLANNTAVFSSYWNDNATSLSKYIFGTNNTGTWVNGTATAFSGTPAWANVTVTTLNPAIGSIVGYEYWANDSANNWVNTGIQTLTTTGYYITVSNDSYSNISPTGLVAVDAGSYQAFTFSPINGSYTIQNVVINSTYQAATSSPYTFLNVQGNESISVSTSSIVYYVNATSDGGCVIVPSGLNLIYPYGVWAKFTCTAYPTYQIYNLAVNGSNLGPASGLDFMPTGNTTLYLTSISTITGQSGGNNYIPPTQTPAPTVQPTTTPIATMPNSTLVDYGIVLIVGVLLIAIVVGYAQVHKKKTLSELFEAR